MENGDVQTRRSVAGVVILYNSPVECFDNIKTYLSQVDRLYIIDNSPTVTAWAVAEQKQNSRLVYEYSGQNVGIATALNRAARRAIADGYTYLLTMDDDSQAPAGMIRQMLAYMTSQTIGTVGIVAPKHLLTTTPVQPSADTAPAMDVLTTMTSGNLLNLAIYEKVGPFYDDLFIDVVDHEYNLRMRQSGYRVVELPHLQLTHRLGLIKRIPFSGLIYVSHSPARNYYLVRNSIVVARRYRQPFPGYSAIALQTIGIEVLKVLLLEDQKGSRLRLIVRAVKDAVTNRLGPLPVSRK